MRRIVLMLIVCLGYEGSASAATWEITEIPAPNTHTVDWFGTWTIDDYGHLYWAHQFSNCDANGVCAPYTFTLYRYDWSTNSVSIISQPPQGIGIGLEIWPIPSSGINVAWIETDSISGSDIFFYDGDEVTQVTNTPGISEWILGVSGDSVYYCYRIFGPYPNESYRLFHAVKRESDALDCNTVRSFGYKLDSDLSGDCYVNFKDLALFAQEWLECIDPINQNCTHPWL
jgi:hypothetical protein